MANIESVDLEGLLNTAHNWLIQNGELTPAEGVEAEPGPNGLLIVEAEASYTLILHGHEVWKINSGAAQIIEVDSNDGKLSLSAFEASYSRWGNGVLEYNPESIAFGVDHPPGYYLENTHYAVYQQEDGRLEPMAQHTHRKGIDRELFRMTSTDDPFSKLAGIEDVEGLDRRFGALTLIVNGLIEHWPAIKAARANKQTGQTEPPAS